jgi:hypothetical protein
VARPGWVTSGLAALVIVIAVYSAGRLAFSRLQRRETESDADVLHVFMGVAMAGMFVPWLSPLPGPVWQVMFAVAAAWFGWQAVRALRGGRQSSRRQSGSRCAYPAAHLVECIAMIYMLWPAGSARPPGVRPAMAMPGMSGPPGAAASFPVLALLLALFMLGYIFWTADRLTSLSRATAAQAARGAQAGHQSAPARPAAAASPADPLHPTGPPGGTVPARTGRPALAPRLAACSKIAMSMAMGYMLIAML